MANKKVSLTENEVDVLWSNVHNLINHGSTHISFDPHNRVVLGKSEKGILKDVLEKLDKIRV